MFDPMFDLLQSRIRKMCCSEGGISMDEFPAIGRALFKRHKCGTRVLVCTLKWFTLVGDQAVKKKAVLIGCPICGDIQEISSTLLYMPYFPMM